MIMRHCHDDEFNDFDPIEQVVGTNSSGAT